MNNEQSAPVEAMSEERLDQIEQLANDHDGLAFDTSYELITEIRRLQGLARVGEELYDKACVLADRVWYIFAIEVEASKLAQWPELDRAYRGYRAAFKAYEARMGEKAQHPPHSEVSNE